jgi:hypothetical protein
MTIGTGTKDARAVSFVVHSHPWQSKSGIPGKYDVPYCLGQAQVVQTAGAMNGHDYGFNGLSD